MMLKPALSQVFKPDASLTRASNPGASAASNRHTPGRGDG